MTSTLRQKRLSATSPTSTPTPRRSGSTTPCRHLAYRCASSAPRRPFTASKQVRAKTVSAPGHIRLPDCTRGHTGVVEVVQPAAALPHTSAPHLSENRSASAQHGFDSCELRASTPNHSHSPWSRTRARTH
ncbi:SH3-like domain-containing protein [Streptomyces sp. NPDC004546]|uniref:SH3-like domain-containing protein n=1 Tax=unclassified Streptomyces TaxID=2593676 RepID=UPI0033A33736